MKCQVCDSKMSKECSICAKALCKDCALFLQRDDFLYHPKPPRQFQKSVFCFECFEKNIAPELNKYKQAIISSKEVMLVRKSYRGKLPLLQKAKAPHFVKNHTDKKEATLHLAFLARWNGFDSVVEFEENCEKVRDNGFERKAWSAGGLFVNLDMKRFRPDPDST